MFSEGLSFWEEGMSVAMVEQSHARAILSPILNKIGPLATEWWYLLSLSEHKPVRCKGASSCERASVLKIVLARAGVDVKQSSSSLLFNICKATARTALMMKWKFRR